MIYFGMPKIKMQNCCLGRGYQYPMNSRERVITTTNFKEPDKVPIDLNGTNCTALTYPAYSSLREYLGLEEDKKIDISDTMQGTVRSKEDILSLYEIDTRTIFLKDSLLIQNKFLPDGSFYDEFGARWKPVLYYYDCIERPLLNATSVNDLKKVKWEDTSDKTRIRGIREEARDLFENTQYCLVADIPAWGPFEGGCVFRGYDNFLMDLYSNVNFAQALLDKITEAALARWEILINEVGEYIQVAAQGDDVGMQNSTFTSPEMYRKFIKPLHKRIFDFIHSRSNAKVFLHTCGSVYDLIPDFIEVGVNILSPVQRGAAKMDIKTLKKEFGKNICFWGGGIDIQQQLPFYTPKQIEEEIKKTIEIMAPGGGFIFWPTHNIQADTTPDRIDSMFKSVIKYRNYKK